MIDFKYVTIYRKNLKIKDGGGSNGEYKGKGVCKNKSVS